MTECTICGIGAVGSFGNGDASLRDALGRPRSYHQSTAIRLADGEVDLPVYNADPSALSAQFPSRAIRRMNRFSKLVAFAANQALADAGVAETIDRSRLGLILATGYGSSATTFDFLDSYYEDDNSYVSPMTFSNSVHASAMSTATILLGITGPSLTINQLEASVPLALATSRRWLATGRVDYVLVGGCDEYCDVLGYTYATLFGPDFTGEIAVRERSTQSAVPGEGAAFALVTKASPLARCADVHCLTFLADSPATNRWFPALSMAIAWSGLGFWALLEAKAGLRIRPPKASETAIKVISFFISSSLKK